jgi:Cytochrome c oxidase subunit IV
VSEDQGHRKQASNKQKASNEAMEQAIKPNQSYWPFALAASLTITLFGVMVHPIVFWVGIALIVVSIVGWGLERH